LTRASARQKAAARRNIKMKRLSKRTRTALGKQANKMKRQKRR
jgi:hypothetical protein